MNKRMLPLPFRRLGMLPVFLVLFSLLPAAMASQAVMSRTATRDDITWTFDREYPVGEFITGDPWVVGPVTVVSVSPAPGPVEVPAGAAAVKSRYGATGMKPDDGRMRNGSMVVLKPGKNQGYDSRLINYSPELSVAFPCKLEANRTLISTVSNETLPVTLLCDTLMWASEKNGPLALKSASVLTCLDKEPPADAFRPPYAGTEKPVYQAKNLHWEILPALKPAGPVPSWPQFERYFARPWLDHQESWLHQMTGPNENQVNYGREFSRLTSIASLMLMLEGPREQKEKLMTGLVQLGIDLHGLAQEGRRWSADGGHWNGRKWPVLFAGLMLDEPKLKTLPPTVLFSEDQQTYYGQGWCGQDALYQMVWHTGPKPPYEEKPPGEWDAGDKRSEGYRVVVSGGLPGTALAVQWMKAKALWNHDAFFDYYDRWMAAADPYEAGRGAFPRPKQEGKSLDPFVDAMWAAHRAGVPAQPGATANTKWVWKTDGGGGEFVPNAKK